MPQKALIISGGKKRVYCLHSTTKHNKKSPRKILLFPVIKWKKNVGTWWSDNRKSSPTCSSFIVHILSCLLYHPTDAVNLLSLANNTELSSDETSAHINHDDFTIMFTIRSHKVIVANTSVSHQWYENFRFSLPTIFPSPKTSIWCHLGLMINNPV